MNARTPANAPPRRAPIAPIHRGPQSTTTAAGTHAPPFHHAPNAALLIDFDNVTMGIRSDLGKELRSLLSSEIIKGKVAVQRAYADWRRYPQYIVPLSESSIDLIFAPAYGSSKKNATDIRLAIDALELVFTRPEIGTFILLSGDSDFSSLVIKLKEYGKYVIGVGIRESSSDLLVQNCDEYYSYNALAGLVKTSEEELVKRDPWELASEAIQRMKRNGDVMRSDRLKQVMQEIDANFDEKNLGISKFSRFCLEAAQRGILKVSRLENGQLEVDVPDGAMPAIAASPAAAARVDGEEPAERSRRGRRGRGGRGRDREERAGAEPAAALPGIEDAERAPRPRGPARPDRPDRAGRDQRGAARDGRDAREHREPAPREARPQRAERHAEIGISGERLTREEAFDLVRQAVQALTGEPGDAAMASDVRRRAFSILGRDSESLSERNFRRILQDAHDADVIDLRRRGDDFEVARAVSSEPVAEQLKMVAAELGAATPAAAPARPSQPRGIGALGRARVRRGEGPPPDLFAVGVVDTHPVMPPAREQVQDDAPAAPEAEEETPRSTPPTAEKPAGKARGEKTKQAAKTTRKRSAAKKQPRKSKSAAAPATPATPAAAAEAPDERRRRPRARKSAAKSKDS